MNGGFEKETSIEKKLEFINRNSSFINTSKVIQDGSKLNGAKRELNSSPRTSLNQGVQSTRAESPTVPSSDGYKVNNTPGLNTNSYTAPQTLNDNSSLTKDPGLLNENISNQSLPINESPDVSNDNKQDINPNIDNKNTQKAKENAAEQLVDVATKAHPVLNAVARSKIGKNTISNATNRIQNGKKGSGLLGLTGDSHGTNNEQTQDNDSSNPKTLNGKFETGVKVKQGVKIAIIAVVISAIVIGFAFLINQITSLMENKLVSMYLASQLNDPDKVQELLDTALEKTMSNDDSDDYLSNSDDSDNSTDSNNSNNSKDRTAILTVPSRSTDSNTNSNVGSFKSNIFYYNQYNYTDPYAYGGLGSIAQKGCGPTSLAIAISSMTQEEHDPIEMTNYLCQRGGCANSGSVYSIVYQVAGEYGEKYGFKAEPTSDTDYVKKRLAEGNSLVITITNGGLYTNSGNLISYGGHYFVLTGIDEEGQAFMSDPANSNNTGRTVNIEALATNSNNRPDAPSFCILTK